jgi:hypothetical protein
MGRANEMSPKKCRSDNNKIIIIIIIIIKIKEKERGEQHDSSEVDDKR